MCYHAIAMLAKQITNMGQYCSTACVPVHGYRDYLCRTTICCVYCSVWWLFCTHTHTHARMHARTHARTHAHTHTHTYIHTHTHTHTHAYTNPLYDICPYLLEFCSVGYKCICPPLNKFQSQGRGAMSPYETISHGKVW